MKHSLLPLAICLVLTACDSAVEPPTTEVAEKAETLYADAPVAAMKAPECPCWDTYEGLVGFVLQEQMNTGIMANELLSRRGSSDPSRL